jgi:hypothetical protein
MTSAPHFCGYIFRSQNVELNIFCRSRLVVERSALRRLRFLRGIKQELDVSGVLRYDLLKTGKGLLFADAAKRGNGG